MVHERLGEVTVPSGVLTLLDPGHIGVTANSMRDVPTVRVEGVPHDRALPVIAERLAVGRWAGCWDWVAVGVGEGAIARSELQGELIVEHGRVLVADDANADAWIHDASIDGKADFVFWGRDAQALAEVVSAPALGDGNFGWCDLAEGEAVRLGTAVEKAKELRGWLLATDYRPHSHHWQALARARSSSTDSGTIVVGGRKVCLLFTLWGDGWFPVYWDRDEGNRLVRVRIQLRTDASEAAMAKVNS